MKKRLLFIFASILIILGLYKQIVTFNIGKIILTIFQYNVLEYILVNAFLEMMKQIEAFYLFPRLLVFVYFIAITFAEIILMLFLKSRFLSRKIM